MISRVAAGGGLQRLGLLLALGRLAIGRRGRDPRPHLDLGRARLAERADVAGRVDDLLDLQRVDHQAELLHLVGARVARGLRELVAVGDQVLDRHRADDRAQVAVEDLADEVVHLALLGLQEAHAGVRDRALVVADLEDRHAAHADRDLLRVDALDLEQRLVGRHAEVLRLLHHGHDERAAAGDDLEDPIARPPGP